MDFEKEWQLILARLKRREDSVLSQTILDQDELGKKCYAYCLDKAQKHPKVFVAPVFGPMHVLYLFYGYNLSAHYVNYYTTLR